MAKKPTTTTYSFKLNRKDYTKLVQISKKRGNSTATTLREIVSSYLEA